MYDIVNVKGHLLSMHNLGRSGFLCYFIEYNALQKSAKKLGNLFITKTVGPNLPLLLSLVSKEKGCSRIYERLMSRNRNILSECAEKCPESLLEEIPEVSLSQSFQKIHKDCNCTYFRYLQSRLLHRRVFINERLF